MRGDEVLRQTGGGVVARGRSAANPNAAPMCPPAGGGRGRGVRAEDVGASRSERTEYYLAFTRTPSANVAMDVPVGGHHWRHLDLGGKPGDDARAAGGTARLHRRRRTVRPLGKENDRRSP